jgi:aminopeptidase N
MKSNHIYFLLLSLTMAVWGCKRDDKTSMVKTGEPDKTSMDTHSYARPAEAVINHLSLDVTADFGSKKIAGTATYDITVHEGADSIFLDSRDLDILKVSVDGVETPFTLGASKEWLGQPLGIPVSATSKKVMITYSTRPGAEALQWLEPSQTAGKKNPYLFTQGQAILTRTWIPIQDSPGIRLTYDAKVTVPKELMAVMSASNPQVKNAGGIYTFNMAQPIPADSSCFRTAW